MIDRVLLLHGLWMRGLVMTALQRRLVQAGFEVESFDYWSVAEEPRPSVERLRERMRKLAPARVHLVGHSLGGVLALQAMRDEENLAGGRIVCLGSPLSGSAAAQGFLHWPGARAMLGRSVELLCKGLPPWNDAREVGVIAGRMPHGLGMLFGVLGDQHDGTVAVSETKLPGITDHCMVAASHAGLVFSVEAARQTIAFLREGRFVHDTD
ncbi:MAG: esterase/lipase family protein [Rhodanobacteraceae bacterium]